MEVWFFFTFVSVIIWIVRVIINASDTTPAPSSLRKMVTRVRSEKIQLDRERPLFVVEAQGPFPTSKPTRIRFVTSVVDVSEVTREGKRIEQPAVSTMGQFQEPDSSCFRDVTPTADVHSGLQIASWSRVATILPDGLVPARAGKRRMRVHVWLIDDERPPKIHHGLLESGSYLMHWAHHFDFVFQGEGYREHSERQYLAEEKMVQLAISVTLADGAFASSESDVLLTWIHKRLDLLEGAERAARAEQLRQIAQDAIDRGRQGELKTDLIADHLRTLTSEAERQEAIELCLDVMSADGVAENVELTRLNEIARRLGIDMDRFRQLQDRRLVGLTQTFGETVDYHALLGMDRSWGQDRVRSHLTQLYGQWNARAEALQDPAKRSQAEKMLETIATARQSLLAERESPR